MNEKEKNQSNNENLKNLSNTDKKSNEKKENEGNVLDKLFLKTKTKPYIYYLPLTEEQVKKKLENKNK